MAGGKCQLGIQIFVVGIMLLCLSWDCEAYNRNQHEPEGGLKRVHHIVPTTARPAGATARPARASHQGGRRLSETGWRATLVNEADRLHSAFNLSGVERIANNVKRSVARSQYFTARTTEAVYRKVPGRKTLAVDESMSNTRRSILQTNLSFESPVEVTSGSYSMAFSIGTPAQNFVAIADTGSDLVWLQCAQCSPCFDQEEGSPFDPSLSSTYADIGCTAACDQLGNNEVTCTPNCQYTYKYGDQSSTTGNFALETLTLNTTNGSSLAIPSFEFGCGLQNQGTFQGTDGLVGLARGPISFPSQIASYLGSNKFSYCLADRNSDNATSPIIFGEDAVPSNASGINYTRQLTPYEASVIPYYYVTLESISVGDTTVDIPASAFALGDNGEGGVIFDSGTTYTVLVTEAYRPVLDAVQASITYPQVDLSRETQLDLCFDVSGLSSVNYAPIVYHFEDADFDLPFENTFALFGTTQETYMCLLLLQGDGINIYGSTQQQNFQVVYDEDNLRIGWVPQDCSAL